MSEAAVVLLVDDEERILSSLQRSLRREGHVLLQAQSGAEALRVLASRPVDLVVSDQQMPGMTGLELIREIDRQWPGTERLLLTGWPGELDPAELRRLRVRAVIAKPWEQDALREGIRAALT